MSIFSTIMEKIFHAPEAGQQTASATTGSPAAASPSSTSAAPSSTSASSAGSGASPAAAAAAVDVGDVLTKKAAAKGGGGNWQTSIVDLLKLLDMDSSLSARKDIANEMNGRAGADGSAEENIALHKAVMRKLAENGGNVPASFQG